MLYSNEMNIQYENGKTVQTVRKDVEKGDKYVNKMHDDADFTVMKVHMCKYDKTYM
jgi:hypothetical protein